MNKIPKFFVLCLLIICSILCLQFFFQRKSPPEKEQGIVLTQEIMAIEINEKFRLIDKFAKIFYHQGNASCTGCIYIEKTVNETFDLLIKLHQKHNWIVEKTIDNYELIMRKNKMRVYVTVMKGKTYGFEDYPDNFVRVHYSYIDGWFEKDELSKH